MYHLPSSICFVMGLLAGLVSTYKHHIEIIPAAESNSVSIAQYISDHNGLDAPHVTPINESAYDWWYFDVVSENADYGVVVVFFNAPETAFPFSGAPANDITEAYLFVSVPGNPFLYAGNISSTQAVVDYAGNGASGVWTASGFSFEGEPDMSEYTVKIDSPENYLKGEISFKSKAPGHYPCSRAESGVSMSIMPGVGWSNAVPDAVSTVKLNVNGTNVDFSGVGYHDKNWGDQPFINAVGSWFWGHGRLGPYSIVWYDALTPTGAEYVSAYVAKDGAIVTGSCKQTSIKVRPSGPGDSYPPSLLGQNPTGDFHISIDLGEEGTLVVDVRPSVEVVVVPGAEFGLPGQVYDRWTGKLNGGISGKEQYTGTALYEQFTFTA